MESKIISGKIVADRIKNEVKESIERECKDKVPVLAVIIVGEDPASKVYVNNKKKACELVGIKSLSYELPENTSEVDLIALVKKLNEDKAVNGILVQLPLPKQINEHNVIVAIDPKKDVDGFHPVNIGLMQIGKECFLPCTPNGIMELIKAANFDLSGKHCVVVGRSNIVGKPIAMLTLQKDATVTICHSKTKNLKEIIKQGDVVIGAVGKAEMITGDMVKEGALLIDVGINRVEDGKLKGDFHFESCLNVCGGITPVPGGVGVMTIAMLMKNCYIAFKRQQSVV